MTSWKKDYGHFWIEINFTAFTLPFSVTKTKLQTETKIDLSWAFWEEFKKNTEAINRFVVKWIERQ